MKLNRIAVLIESAFSSRPDSSNRLSEMNKIATHARIKYRADIDGLRAFAVVAVIAFHVGFKGAPGGFVGFDIFVAISD